MKVDIFNVEEFIKINNLQEITSSILFQRGDIPDPRGLISNEIFGITTKSRKETFAYINLHKPYLHPLAYKALNRIFRNIDKIINGEDYYNITSEGSLVVDRENGSTGLQWLYDNWNKIKWKEDESNVNSMRNERINFLQKNKRDEVFMRYQIVIPAFYRDIKSTNRGSETDDINNLYGRLIRAVSENKDDGRFEFQLYLTDYNIQNIIVEIYNYCKNKIEKKRGLIRKYLLGKNVDYCTRSVITGSQFHANRKDDLKINFKYSGIPISHIITLCYPFIFRYVKNFFETEIYDKKNSFIIYNKEKDEISSIALLENTTELYNDRFIEKMLSQYQKDQECRFNVFEIPSADNDKDKYYLHLVGRRMSGESAAEAGDVLQRPMTWTDLLYLACEEVVKDKHCLLARYPIRDEFNMVITKIRVISTLKTIPMYVNGNLYPFYPDVDITMEKYKIGSAFVDSITMSNSYLEGLDADFDGDQITAKILFTQEANEECDRVINSKGYFVNTAGSNVRVVSKEALQTIYVLTKDPYGVEKQLTKEETLKFAKMDPNDITFEFMVENFATRSKKGNIDIKNEKPKYHPTDTIYLSNNEFPLIKSNTSVKTTLGRLIFAKVFIEGCNLEKVIPYKQEVITAKKFKAIDKAVSQALLDDVISVNDMTNYIDTRDWFGFQMHSLITTSYTMKVLVTPEIIKKKRDELFELHKEELANGDASVMEDIEQELLDMIQKEYKGDIGMDLYLSGARGSVGNHLKNINITRGAVYNPVTKKYDMLKNSLMDGIAKRDIGANSNVIITGSFPKAVGTKVSGYLSKEFLAFMQAEVLADKDTDCNTNKTVSVLLTDSNINDYMYRYIKEGSKLVYLDRSNINEYRNKVVHLRSPMFCKGIGKNGHICNKCAGNFFYKVGKKNIGLTSSLLAETTKQLNLQKFHDNTITTVSIDPNDMLLL